ncbi:MAG TPA: V-type ATP synthase subunit I [Candidatus Ruminococcus gallistercoris]|nr:V-type ATP synthase subunit I [Candidatus Ruminococcus gallistercoris]
MAVMPMQRIGIYALKSRRKPILELIQRRGVVEIHAEKAEDAVFRQTDTAPAKARFENNTSTLQAALEALDKLEPEKKSLLAPLEGRTPIPLSRYEETAGAAGKTLRAASRVNALWKKCADDRAEILRLEAQIRMLEPWSRLDVSMRTTGTASTAAFIGSFPAEYTEEALKAEIARGAPEIDGVAVEVLSAGTQQTCAFLLCHASNGAKLEAFLRSIGFTYPADRSKKPPQARMQDLNARIEKLRAEIDGAEAEIRTYAALRGAMQYTIDYFSMRIEKYDVLGRLWQSPHVFVITGYIPAESAPALEKELTEKFEAYVELETPAEDEDVPVKLKNNAFAAPVEGVLESYSMPGRKEIDPSTLMAVFYYFLFGMMLSDAGYGLLMVIGCGVALAEFKNMEESLRKFLKMFLYCGISTVFWGAMFGSFFGDAVTVIGKTFFNVDIAIPALWFTPLNEPMRLLLFSFLIGVIHLFAGLGAQFYQLARQGLWKDAIFDVVFWYMLVGGGILYLLSMQMFADMVSLGFTLPAAVGTAGAIAAGIGAVGIVLTAGRESRSPFKRLLKGLYGLYGVSSYLSDILSYSRLLALGLATGVIASVFNQMGAMLGNSPAGVAVFVFAFLVGHTLNLGINVLGAYVHTNRLQFVEFFGKFFEGGSRKFNPFSAKTKYFKITEEK